MSRRKKSDDGALFIIVIVAAILILAPIVILFFFVYQLYLRSKQQVTHYNIKSVWLNIDEKIQFIKCYEAYTSINEKVTSAHQLAKEKQISINKDGSYSKRSNLGKKICSILDIYEPQLHNTENELFYLASLPWKRWDNFNKNFN